MKMNVFLLWFFLAIAILVSSLWQFFPLPDAQQRLALFPLQGKDFSGKEIPFTPFEKEFFKSIHIIKRIYQVGSQNIFVYVLDGTHNRHLVHDPFYCFRGAGWEIGNEKTLATSKGEASLVLLTKDGESKETLYWFSDGFIHYKSPLIYWWQTTLRRLTLGFSGGEPLLIIVQPVEAKPIQWSSLLKKFDPLFQL